MSHPVSVPRPKVSEILVDKEGRPTKEHFWFLWQLWERTGGAADTVADALISGNNLSDVQSASSSRTNLGFVDPILDKASPGNIGTGTPGTITGTTGSFTGTLSASGAFTATTTLTVTGKFFVDANKNVAVGNAALATTATDGFLYIPTTPGAPTGTPTAKTGLAPMVYDSTNDELYIFNGSWKSAVFA